MRRITTNENIRVIAEATTKRTQPIDVTGNVYQMDNGDLKVTIYRYFIEPFISPFVALDGKRYPTIADCFPFPS